MTTTALPAQSVAATRRCFTVDEFLAMDHAGIFHPEERLELLDGEIFVMPPIGPPHADGTDQFDDFSSFRCGVALVFGCKARFSSMI